MSKRRSGAARSLRSPHLRQRVVADKREQLVEREVMAAIREAARLRPDLFCECQDHCPSCDPLFDWSGKIN